VEIARRRTSAKIAIPTGSGAVEKLVCAAAAKSSGALQQGWMNDDNTPLAGGGERE
jgi:hypothetical protein